MSAIDNSTVPIQIESVQTGNPVSESSLIAIGGAVNYCLSNKPAVGDILMSALDEATFQSQRDTTWVLADGRSVVGSRYQALTGQTNIPDLRGRYPRGKDNGAGVDPHGNLPVGTTYADQLAAHEHTVQTYVLGGPTFNGVPLNGTGSPEVLRTTVSGPVGAETNPKTTIVQIFIKIND